MKRSWRRPVAIAITAFSALVAIASVLFVTARPAVAAMIARHTREPWADFLADALMILIAVVIARTLDAALTRIVRSLW